VSLVALLALVAAPLLAPTAAASGTARRVGADSAAAAALAQPPPTSLVRLRLPSVAALDAAVSEGLDVAGDFARVPEGVEVDAVVTAEEIAALQDDGALVLPADAPQPADLGTSRDPAAGERGGLAALQTTDTVKVGRVDYFTTKGQGFLSVEAKTSLGDDPAVTLDLAWDRGPGTAPDSGGTARMGRFFDSGVYMYHRLLLPIDGPRPATVTVTSSAGGSDTGEVSDWLYPVHPLTDRPGYRYDFVDGYEHPTQLYARLEELARQHPDITELITLPHRTNGYQRKAQAILGSGNASAVVVTSQAWGHEGGNDITVEIAAPQGPNQTLSVSTSGTAITVTPATDAAGNITSTAAQVAEALRTQAGHLVYAHTYRGNAGNGVVSPSGVTQLTDFLSAPEEIERGPFTMRALRIGKHRDGSRPGVLIIAQDHAREWVPPMVAMETVERLLANSTRDAETRRILEEVDIFVVPSNNPDGSHYSFFDRNQQRRNMTNYCDDANSDPGRRHNWGVDLNRNYRVGSAHDGYSGGSFSCTSDTYQGPEKLSEPEAKNVIALVEAHPNIKFFMTIHSNGGQLFWQPGAYIAQGRITTPRPEMRDEAFYWQSAERILSHVKAYQDTVVRPDNVGGSADVLYSSAGNVREDLYNNYGIYAFGWEVGGSVWDPETRRWIAGSFQPDWDTRGHGETMEYANGVMEMFRIAADWGRDRRGPTATLVTEDLPDGTVGVRFETSEPATVYYTTDGSAPTFDSPRYQAAGIREGGQTLVIDETTTFHWFSVDTAGNIERGYDPERGTRSFRRATVRVD